MKKTFKLLMAFVIALFTLPVFGSPVFAQDVEYEDGEYNITAKAMHADNDEPSGAAGFISEEALLSIQDGNYELTITVPNNDMAQISGLQVEGAEPTIEETDEARNMTYQLSDLTSELNAQVQYEVPALDMKHDVSFRFVLEGLDDLPVVEEEPETPEEPEQEDSDKEEPTEAPEEREVGTLLTEEEADAVYQLNYETDSRATSGQLENPVKLLEKDNKEYIQIPVNENGAQFFRSLKFNGEEVTWNSITEGPYTIQFELTNGIADELDVSMVIQAGPRVMPHDGIKLWFDEESLETIKEPKPEEEPAEDPVEEPKEEPKEQPTSDEGTDVVEETNMLTPDKAYEIDYIIKHETEDQASAADNFFQKPGVLLEKDGVYYLQVTVTSSNMVDALETEFGPALIVEDNGDSMVVQFRVNDDLSQATVLDMHITVPGMYSMDHSTRVFLDSDSMAEVNAENYELVAGSEENQNGPLVEGAAPGSSLGGNGDKNGNGDDNGNNNDDGTPSKPKFGDNDETPGAASQGKNPQTGDTSSILLYSLLLIGSMIPLAVKLKRRFV